MVNLGSEVRTKVKVKTLNLQKAMLPGSQYLRQCLCFRLAVTPSPFYPSQKNAHKCSSPNQPVRRKKEILAWFWNLRPLATMPSPSIAHNSFFCEELSTYVSPQLAYAQLYLPGRLEVVLSPASASYGFPFP